MTILDISLVLVLLTSYSTFLTDVSVALYNST